MTGVLYLGDRVEWLQPGQWSSVQNPTGRVVALDTGRGKSCVKIRWDAPLVGHHDADHKPYADVRKIAPR